MKRIFYILISLTFLLPISNSPVYAVSGSEWKAGRIIDDGVFTDSNAMSVADIDNFLRTRLPSCDTWGRKTSEFGGGTRAQYALNAYGIRTPFTCITDYYEVPKTAPGGGLPVNNYGQYNTDGTPNIPIGAVSVAQMIQTAAKKYTISPRALLIKLATESAGPLTSDDWPMPAQYYYAMGAHCPDSGPGGSANCDSNYAGFSIQIDESAKLLRYYLDNMQQSWWSFKRPYQTNPILWNVKESGCGAGDVYLETKASAALYTYTPYQPNKPALDNMYGEGDGCSAYGNRNFWRVWNDWFGATDTPLLRSWESGKMYLRNAAGSLYYITNANQLADLGYGNGGLRNYIPVSDSYIQNYTTSDLPALLRFGNLPEVYTYAAGSLHYVDYATYIAYGSPATGSLLPSAKSLMTVGENASTAIRDYKSGSIFSVQNGQRRYVVGPDAYTHFSINQIATSTGGPTLLSAIPESMPLASPGTVLKASDGSLAGVASTDANSIYPLNSDLQKSLQLYATTLPASTISKYSLASQGITNLAKSASGTYYLIDQTFKIRLDSNQKAALGYPEAYYTQAPDVLLNRLAEKSYTTNTLVVKIGGLPNTYLIQNKELLWLETFDDLLAYGYTANDVVTITKNTLDTYFNYKNAAALPVGLLVRATNDVTVYLLTSSGGKSRIPTAYFFKNLGLSFEWVRVTSPQSVDRIPMQESISSYAYDKEGNPWLLYNGQRRLIPPAYVKNYNLPIPSDNQVTPWHLSSLPRTYNATAFIRIDSSTNVYYVENGQTHLLSYAQYISRSNNRWNDITPVSSDLFNTLPAGNPYL